MRATEREKIAFTLLISGAGALLAIGCSASGPVGDPCDYAQEPALATARIAPGQPSTAALSVSGDCTVKSSSASAVEISVTSKAGASCIVTLEGGSAPAGRMIVTSDECSGRSHPLYYAVPNVLTLP